MPSGCAPRPFAYFPSLTTWCGQWLPPLDRRSRPEQIWRRAFWAGCSGAAAAPQWTSCGRAVSSAMLPNGAFSYTTSLTPAVPALAAALFAAGRLRSEVPRGPAKIGLLKIGKPETKPFENGHFRGPKPRGYSPIFPEFPPAAPAIPGRLRRSTPQALRGRLARLCGCPPGALLPAEDANQNVVAAAHRTRDLRPATLRTCPGSDVCGQAGSQSHLCCSGCAAVLQGSALC